MITLILLFSGLLLRIFAPEKPVKPYSSTKIEKKVQSIMKEMNELLDKIVLEEIESHQHLWHYLDTLKMNNIDVLVYQGFDLVAWTSRLLPVDGYSPNYFLQPVVRLDNGWYLTQNRQKGQTLMITFYLLKHEYPYQNNQLIDGFSSDFGLDASSRILKEPDNASFTVNDENNNPLFFISGNSEKKFSIAYIISNWLLFLMLLSLFIFFNNLQRHYSSLKFSNLLFFIAVILFTSVYYLVFWKWQFSFLQQTEIFSPFGFAMSNFMPSLGMFLVMSLWIFVLSFWFFRFFKLPLIFVGKVKKNVRSIISLAVFLFCTLFILVIINKLFYLLGAHSSGDLVLTKIIEINWTSITKLLIITLLLFSFLLFYEKTTVTFLNKLSKHYIALTIAGVTVPFLLFYKGIGVGDSDWAFLFFLILGIILVYTKRKTPKTMSYGYFLWFAVVFTIYTGMMLIDLNIKQEESERELLIENLSFQLIHNEDAVAEMYLIDIEKQLAHDASLIRLLSQSEIDQEAIYNHLLKYYFYGYWSRYEMQVIPCTPHGSIYIEETEEINACYQFFFVLIEDYGYIIDGCSHFHYLENQKGKVSFFGIFRFFPNEIFETSIFIELNSKPFFEGMGYPELLVNHREQSRRKVFENYSYAKYVNGLLVKCSGDYPYKNSSNSFHSVLYSKIFQKDGNISHLIYQPDLKTVIVMSRQDMTVGDVFMAFSIFFMFFFLFGALFIFSSRVKFRNLTVFMSIQKRMQTGFVVLMMILLIIVAIWTIFYLIKQFERKHLELLENKVQSVLLELENKIGFDGPETTIPVDYLNYQLQMISSVFYCDINIYGIDGILIGTSRHELFRNGLIGSQMNPKAYYSLAYTDSFRFLEEENIGNLKYTSFYVPLLGDAGRLLGFVNLPYFVGNNELKAEISSLIVTIINFYLIFSFLVISLAVLLSRRITKPLLTLQSKLSQLKLDYQNEKIDYKGNDEIGSLVSEYNRMVEQLADSAEKLARTERELAWREMAKQIAHEIKNPLTPMKLNIQYLQRAWKDKVPNFDEYLKRVTATLIEQIENLSSIASEFSYFAQMPKTKYEIVNLPEKVENSVMLFKNSTNIPIIIENNVVSSAFVKADGEQLLGVFNNLIKNAIQSISDENEGKITVTVETLSDKVKVTISDNGTGISEDVRKKLFTPNFTTKSGGMGLGLAISRRVVESAGGQIWFDSNEENGSNFYVELPQLSDSDSE